MQSELDNQPEPATPEGWQAVPGGAMIAIEGSVLFASGRAELRREGTSTLDVITSTIQSTYPDKDVYVFGHTDNNPKRLAILVEGTSLLVSSRGAR